MRHVAYAFGAAVTLGLACTAVLSDESKNEVSAAVRLNEPGVEANALAARVGDWDVVATFWPTPDAKPMVTKDLVAHRAMVGTILQETMQPAASSSTPAFQRLAYLYYSRVEGRWQYVSMDTRLPVGIMPATSFDAESATQITLQFEPLAFVGFGPSVEGRMIRSTMVLTRDGPDRDRAQQYWVAADGTGRKWLAVQYEFTRRR